MDTTGINSVPAQLNQELREFVALVFGRQVQDVPDNAAMGTYEPWDSLGHVAVMMALEAEFGVKVPTERLGELVSLELIEGFLRENGRR